MYIAADKFFLRNKLVLKQPPINRRRWILIYTVIVYIACHSNDFIPRVGRTTVHKFSDGSGRRAPVVARKIFRDNHNWTFLQFFLPSYVSSSDKGNAHSLEEAG